MSRYDDFCHEIAEVYPQDCAHPPPIHSIMNAIILLQLGLTDYEVLVFLKVQLSTSLLCPRRDEKTVFKCSYIHCTKTLPFISVGTTEGTTTTPLATVSTTEVTTTPVQTSTTPGVTTPTTNTEGPSTSVLTTGVTSTVTGTTEGTTTKQGISLGLESP